MELKCDWKISLNQKSKLWNLPQLKADGKLPVKETPFYSKLLKDSNTLDMVCRHSVFKKKLALDGSWVYPAYDKQNNPCGTQIKVSKDPVEWVSIENFKP